MTSLPTLEPAPPIEARLPPQDPAARVSRASLLVHAFVCSLGLLGAAAGLATGLYDLIFGLRLAVPMYNEWAYAILNPKTPFFLLTYGLSLAALFSYYAAVAFAVGRKDVLELNPLQRIASRGTWTAAGYLLGLAVFNALIFVLCRRTGGWPLQPKMLCLDALWFAVAAWPFSAAVWKTREKINALADSPAARRVFQVAAVAVGLHFISLFYPYLSGRLEMMNEFMDIPEQTRLGDSFVDNTEYINRNGIGALLKYDLRTGGVPAAPAATSARIARTPLLERFIRIHYTAYRYDEKAGALVINRAMLPEEYAVLRRLAGPEAEKARIDDLYYASIADTKALSRRVYTQEQIEFIRKNGLEIHWQVLSRWVLHHHNFLLAPITEYALGKPVGEINLQYGLFNVVLMKNLLEWTGGISYQNYFRVWYSFWPLYYACFVGFAFLLFRDVRVVLATMLLAFASILALNYQILFLGPGLNPIRRFLDVLVAAGLLLYLRRDSKAAFAAALLMSLAAIVNNKQFGLFLSAALLATLGMKYLYERRIRWFEAAGLVVTAAGVLALLFSGSAGADSMSRYYLEGFASPHLTPTRIWAILGSFAAVFTLMTRFSDGRPDLKYTAWFLLLYAQALMTYAIWGASINHFLNIAPVAALAAVAAFFFLIEESRLRPYRPAIAAGVCLAALTVLYLPACVFYYKAEGQYRRLFTDHRVHHWNFERARFVTTMDPAPFEEALRAVEKYAPGKNGIHLVSKYDYFLPFLAGRYSAMPYFDVGWFLITPREIAACVEKIRKDAPEYLFVDSDIGRNRSGEVLNRKERMFVALHQESTMRAQRLAKLAEVFDAVAADYRPVEKGQLLTVYKRVGGAR